MGAPQSTLRLTDSQLQMQPNRRYCLRIAEVGVLLKVLERRAERSQLIDGSRGCDPFHVTG